jgi:hypothetical protein
MTRILPIFADKILKIKKIRENPLDQRYPREEIFGSPL